MANIVGVRLDERLIHGQVATAWNFFYKADRIMVIDDEVVTNTMLKTALKMACPSTVKLSILSNNTAIKNLGSGKYGNEKIFIICKDLKYLLNLLDEGVKYDKIILGNLSNKEGAVQYRKSVYLTEKDCKIIEEILEHDVDVTLQMIPADVEETYQSVKERLGE